ncbi:MAG: hypothetical protein R3F43_15265 [bacterium]
MHRWLLLAGAVLMPACLPDFPERPQVPRSVTDDGIPDDQGLEDEGLPPGDGPPGRDAGPVDARPPEPDVVGGCDVIRPSVPAVRFRLWPGDDAGERTLTIAGGCPPVVVAAAPPWLVVDPGGDALTLKLSPAGLPPGRSNEGLTLQDALGNTLTVPVVVDHFASGPSPAREPKALVIAVGGLQRDIPPTLAYLLDHGAQALDAAQPTLQRPGLWAGLLTGVEAGRHGVDAEPARVRVPSFPRRARDAGHPALVATQYAPLAQPMLAEDLGEAIVAGDSAATRGALLGALQANQADLFILAGDQTVGVTDGDADVLLGAVLSRPTYAQEDWLFVVVGVTPGQPTVPLGFARPGSPPAGLGPRASALDVAPTVLRHLKIDLEPGWQLPGDSPFGGTEADCADRLDDDGDGRIDCRDADCADRCNLSCVDLDVGMASGVLARGLASQNRFSGEACGGGDAPEVTVFWTAPSTDEWLIHADGTTFNSILYAAAGDCDGEEIACETSLYGRPEFFDRDPGGVWLQAREGRSAVLVVDGQLFTNGGEIQLSAYGRAAECRLATDLGQGLGVVSRGSNMGTPTRLPPREGDGACTGGGTIYATGDLLFRWTAPENGTYRFSTAGSSFDTILRLYGGRCDTLALLACNDDAVGVTSSIDANVAAGTVVMIAVSGYWQSGNGGDRGDYQLSIERR